MLRLLVAVTVIAFAPAAHAADQKQMDENKKAVVEFYDLAINQKNFEAAAKFLGPRYVQHNPRAADGPEGLKGLSRLPARQVPQLSQRHQTRVRRRRLCHPARAQRADPRRRGNAIIDIFKLENGKVVEHWDVRQEIPEQSANSNTMF